jgi:hypothetical protein
LHWIWFLDVVGVEGKGFMDLGLMDLAEILMKRDRVIIFLFIQFERILKLCF